MILTAGRSGWWIETELQNRFHLKWEMEFGILGSDDGLPEFSGWGGKWGMDRWPGFCLLTNGFEHHKCRGKDCQNLNGISIS